MPRENEVVVACVGDITAETWFSVLADYPNVSVYLPLGVCDKCRNTGGEDILGEAIATAEEWAGTGMGLRSTPRASSAISFASTSARSTWKRLPAPRA